MFGLSHFQMDWTSFGIGCLVATLFWLIFLRFRRIFPVVFSGIKNQYTEIRKRNLANVEDYIRLSTLRQAQKLHLTSNLFSLDEIAINPRILVPPSYIDLVSHSLAEPLISQIIPYMPDWPEFAAQFAPPALTPSQILENGVNIALIGRPGSGKSFTLAYLASQLCRKDPSVGKISDHLPLLINVLDTKVTVDEGNDPLDPIIQSVIPLVPVLVQSRVANLVHQLANDGKLLILLDGVDELPGRGVQEICKALEILIREYPTIQIISTLHSDFLDGMAKIGFFPAVLLPWSRIDISNFIGRWNHLWFEHVENKPGLNSIDARLLISWLNGETASYSPLEWTLKVIAAYNGSLLGPNPSDVLDSYIQTSLEGIAPLSIVEQLAAHIIQSGQPGLSYQSLDKFLTGILGQARQEFSTAQANLTTENANSFSSETIKNERITSSGSQVLNGLLGNRLLISHNLLGISFVNVEFLSYLASFAIPDPANIDITNYRTWAPLSVCLNFMIAQNKMNTWVMDKLQVDQSILLQDVFQIARSLKDAPPNAEWRSPLLKKLVMLIHQESIPFGIRTRAVAGIMIANDMATPSLFKQLAASNSDRVRRLAALGCGSIHDPRLIDDLIRLLQDPVPDVRYSACYALGVINSSSAVQSIQEILFNGDENMRQASAEILAANGQNGYELLKKAVKAEDILTRRAAILGLVLINEPWARKEIEQTAIEDGQWVVRNVATQAIETLDKQHPGIPRKLPPPYQSPWLIAFASTKGVGIPVNSPALDLLMEALQSEKVEDRLASLTYLRTNPNNDVLAELNQIASKDVGELSDAALYALWIQSISGNLQ